MVSKMPEKFARDMEAKVPRIPGTSKSKAIHKFPKSYFSGEDLVYLLYER
jgi:hypothetical protein